MYDSFASEAEGVLESVLEEVKSVLRRLEAPDVEIQGAGRLSVILRGVADAQARLFRSLEYRLQVQENCVSELRQHNASENARRSQRLVELTEILAGHGGVLAELQQFRKEEPSRRQSLLAECSSFFQAQERGVVELAQRLDGTDALVADLRRYASEQSVELQQLHKAEGENRSRVNRLKEEVMELCKYNEETFSRHNGALLKLQQSVQQQDLAVSELQRWSTGRQRSRVRQLEAEVASSAVPSRESSPSPLSSSATWARVGFIPSPGGMDSRGGSLNAPVASFISQTQHRLLNGSSSANDSGSITSAAAGAGSGLSSLLGGSTTAPAAASSTAAVGSGGGLQPLPATRSLLNGVAAHQAQVATASPGFSPQAYQDSPGGAYVRMWPTGASASGPPVASPSDKALHLEASSTRAGSLSFGVPLSPLASSSLQGLDDGSSEAVEMPGSANLILPKPMVTPSAP